MRGFAELYDIERLADVELVVRIRADIGALVQVRKGVASWFVLACADDSIYRASARNGPLFGWVARSLGCCPYGKLGCSEHAVESDGLARDPVEVVFTRIKGSWRHVHCFEERPYAA
jgi:hypothetical protein